MSEVNADGVLLNPHEAILQEAQNLTNSLMAERPQGLEEDMEHDVQAGNGEEAGEAGGAPHLPVADTPRQAPERRPSRAGAEKANRRPLNRRSL